MSVVTLGDRKDWQKKRPKRGVFCVLTKLLRKNLLLTNNSQPQLPMLWPLLGRCHEDPGPIFVFALLYVLDWVWNYY